ncbi:MAG: hypothetical protein KGI06_04020, partial [Candidatus Micrarchaeota archaeon]|nr:hypothetical protein [Candidatus Micrarchaeota archaeon]
FVEKNKFGDGLRSRLLRMQRKEMVVVDIVYNIYRYMNHFILFWKDFYTASCAKYINIWQNIP